MSGQGSGSNRGGAVMGAVAGVVVVVIGLLIWSQGAQPPGSRTSGAEKPAPAIGTATVARSGGPAPAEPVAEPAAEPAVLAPSAPAPAEPAPAPILARYDALRVTPEGALTLAGTVAPGAVVEVLLDGAVIDTQTGDAQGAFASVVMVAPSAEPRSLGLRVTGADGVARIAPESLTVAPSPLALAQAQDAEAEKIAAAEALAARPLVTDATGGARLLAGAVAELVIDTLAFGADGVMSVSGRGAPAGAALRAYVDNAEVGLVRPDALGAWQMRLPAAAPGAHVLRIDVLDAAGQVLARAEQGFEAVVPAAAQIAARLPDLPLASAELAATPPAMTTPAMTTPEMSVPEMSVPAMSVTEAPAAPVPQPADAATEPAIAVATGAGGRAVTILRGHTLWAIAREAYGDPYLYVQIFEANRDQIRDPNLIYPGQVFALPQ